MLRTDRDSDRRSRPWPPLVSGIGVAFAGTHVAHLVLYDEGFLSSVFGAGIPLLVSCVVIVAGVWIWKQRFDPALERVIVLWTVGGTVAATVLAGFVLGYGFLEGTVVDDTLFLVASVATAGAAAGVVVGGNDALRRRRVEQIASLQRAAAELLGAESAEAVAEAAVSIADDVLDMRINGVWLLSDDEVLRPVAISTEGRVVFDDDIPVFREGNSLSWRAFDDGAVRWYTDVSEQPGRYDPETVNKNEIIIPLGDHGVMNVGSVAKKRFDETDVTLAKMLAGATTAALERAIRDEQLRERATELERQNDRLDRFAAVVSHDLRNPLSIARGYTDLAVSAIEGGDIATATDHLGNVESAHERMERLIENLLELARSAGPVEDTEPVPLSVTARETWAVVETADATLELAPSAEAVAIRADPARLRQLFENLFRNAVKHADERVTVTIEATDRGFSVADDGPGIDPANRDRVFEWGFTTDAAGVGLGLATVREIATDHGWTVSIADTDGGARFEFVDVDVIDCE